MSKFILSFVIITLLGVAIGWGIPTIQGKGPQGQSKGSGWGLAAGAAVGIVYCVATRKRTS